jgi:hypothetical protein
LTFPNDGALQSPEKETLSKDHPLPREILEGRRPHVRFKDSLLSLTNQPSSLVSRPEHYSASTALECATQCGDLLLVPLRLTFCGSSNASEFCNCSDTVCDITNELLYCEDWDPSEIHSSIQSQIPSTPLTLDSSIPFAEALPLAVDVPTESIGKVDNFIDDLIVTILGNPDNISRGNAAAALALELVSRPPLPRTSGLFQQTPRRRTPGRS